MPSPRSCRRRCRRAGGRGGVLFLDLDNFKRINDHYGHGFGDQLLKAVALAISGCLAEGQTLARLGGDEFIVLQEGAEVHELEATSQRIIERLREPFRQGLIEVTPAARSASPCIPNMAPTWTAWCAAPTSPCTWPRNRGATPIACSCPRWTAATPITCGWTPICARPWPTAT